MLGDCLFLKAEVLQRDREMPRSVLISEVAKPPGAIQTQYSAPECDDSADLVHDGRGFYVEGTIPELLKAALDKAMLASDWSVITVTR